MDEIYLNDRRSFSFSDKLESLPFNIDSDLVKSWVKEYKLSTEDTKDFSLELEGRRFRAHLFHSKLGWTTALRLLPKAIIPFKDLHIHEQEVLSISSGTGLTLFCGPTSAGKSTTMCTVVDTLLKQGKLGVAITIEDPIEYFFNEETIFQREVGVDVSSFSSGLIDAVRATPRTIVIGEIRDKKTAFEAIRAGLNGHRVFATLHAISIKEAVSRLSSLIGEEHSNLLVQALQGICVQYLVHKDADVHCIYETLKFDNKVKNVLSSALDKDSSSTLNLLNHSQYEQKRETLETKETQLIREGILSQSIF
jgi:Tfp pilus assembly pilus retraction ATPase PilT